MHFKIGEWDGNLKNEAVGGPVSYIGSNLVKASFILSGSISLDYVNHHFKRGSCTTTRREDVTLIRAQIRALFGTGSQIISLSLDKIAINFYLVSHLWIPQPESRSSFSGFDSCPGFSALKPENLEFLCRLNSSDFVRCGCHKPATRPKVSRFASFHAVHLVTR